MKEAKEEIVEVAYKEALYYVSILEKENDSGIMYNERLFFLLPEKYIGYISDVKADDPPSKIKFEKSKISIPITQLRSFVLNERELHIKVVQSDGARKLEKDWNLRMASPALAKKWYDRLQREKLVVSTNKVTPKIEKSNEHFFKSKKTESKLSPVKKQMQITRSQSFTYKAKPEAEKMETGVGISPRNSESDLRKQVTETKEIGTAMSQKPESVVSSLKQPKQPSINSPIIEIKPPQAGSERTKLMGKLSKQAEAEDLTDRSLAQPFVNKSIHSQPASRKVEPFRFNKKTKEEQRNDEVKSSGLNSRPANNNEYINNLQNKSSKSKLIKQLPKDSDTPFKKLEQSRHSVAQNDHQQSKLPLSNQVQLPIAKVVSEKQEQEALRNSGIKSIKSLKREEVSQLVKELPSKSPEQNLELSNKKYITEEEFEKLNTSTPMNYYERTSQLIKSSSAKSRAPQSPKQQSLLSERPSHNEEAGKSLPESKYLKVSELKPSYLESSNLKLSIKEVKEEYEENNESEELHKIIKDEFSSITVREDRSLEKGEELPWTYKYIEFGDQVFEEFQSFSMDLLQELVEDLRLPPHSQTYKSKFIRDNIYHYNVADVEAKVALIAIEETKAAEGAYKERVCNKDGIKLLENEFNNFQLLYSHLGSGSRLKVPLVCLCEVNGFVGLFKILPKGLQKQIRMREIESQIGELRARTKISNSFYHNHNKNIIQLDENYYRSLDRSTQGNFNLYFLQEIDEYLLPDCVTERENSQRVTLLRKELIAKYGEEQGNDNLNKSKPISKLAERPASDAEKLSKNLLKALSEAIIEIDSLSVYFFNSKELGEYLHEKGLNLRYLGHIYENLTTPFQRRLIMSEIAARSCKSLFRKTIQDIVLEQEATPQLLIVKSCDFLNCITSNSFETAAIWKVLSTHSLTYFGVEISFEQIEKGYFLVSLIQNCGLDISWEKIHPERVFNENLLFTEKNLLGLRPKCKTYLPDHNEDYVKCRRILEEPHSEEGLRELVSCINAGGSMPPLFDSISNNIKSYVSLFISPYRSGEEELKSIELYPASSLSGPSRSCFDLLLMEIKWHLKYKDRENYIKKCDQFIGVATKYFGEFHPIFSELYDLFSSYHISSHELEDATTFAKSSLVNILKVCGTGHGKTSECYYNLALCYIRCGKKEEAFSHMKKARQIFENNGGASSVPYAAISLKLALIYLNQDQTQDCLLAALTALAIFQAEDLAAYEEELVDCYEMITRCYEITQQKDQIQHIADQCESRLAEISSPHNLERALKIVIYPFLSEVSPQAASSYIDIISQFAFENRSQFFTLAYENLRIRIREGSFMKSLGDYMENLREIEDYIREAGLLGGWESFKEVYPRETVNDFVALSEELIAFLGEGFLTGSLREAL